MSDHDVCIVGFGPTGAVAAALLADAGHRVLVIDRLFDVYDKPRAIALDHEIMRLFQQLGVVDAVLPHVAVYPPSEYRGVSGEIIKRLDAAPPPLPQGWAPNYAFTQPPVEAILRQRAVAAGADVRLGHTLCAIEQDGDGVTAELVGPSGERSRMRAAFLIGADGANSTVRRLTGLALQDLAFDEPWLVADVQVDDAALAALPNVNVQYCEPARPATYVVGPGNHRRWEIMLDPGEVGEAMPVERVWSLLTRWVSPATATLWRSATYRFHAVVAAAWRQGRVFVAGDAAHQQPPFLGQGMCQGLRDAANLAWKLDLVLTGRADAVLLDSYGAERRAHVTALIEAIKALGRFICERDPAAAQARDTALIAEMGGGVVTTYRQDVMPILFYGFVSRQARRGRGELFPQPRLASGVLLDDVIGTGFRLIVMERCALPALAADALPKLTVARIGPEGSEGALVEADGIVTAWLVDRGAVAALVRPDNYVFGIVADAVDVPSLIDECRRALNGAS